MLRRPPALVQGNTVTLIGNASALDKAAAERVAQPNPSVDEVINLFANRSPVQPIVAAP
jgi:osmotically-inducible protein OsmY